MGAGLFSYLVDRSRVVDFSRVFGREGITVLMRSPERASKKDSLLAPFKKEVNNLVHLLRKISVNLILQQ